MAFKDNLRRIREEKGFRTAKEFTERGLKGTVNYTTYHAYENTNRMPSENLIVAIAKALKVSIDDLFGYDVTNLKRKSEIDTAVDFLKDLGIEAKKRNNEEVSITINKTNIANIPNKEILNIVNASKDTLIPHTIVSHFLYSIVMHKIISYGKTGKTVYKKAKVIKKSNIDEMHVQYGKQPRTVKKKTEK